MLIAALMFALAPTSTVPAKGGCASSTPGAILVCGNGPQPYRIDPDVVAGAQASERDQASSTAPVPAAQAACAQSAMGCGKGLESLDLGNAARVVGTMAVKAAAGEDWTKLLGSPGPGEYQRFLEAKQLRQERAADRAAQQLRDQARAAAEQ